MTGIFLSSCAHWPENPKLKQVEPLRGYRFQLQARPDNSQDMIVILAFSGGGTRAASFSYGVLEELSRTTIPVQGRQRRFIDEVDIISAVSGGSFTAAYYALYGDRIFSEFENKFLKRNVESDLYWKIVNPVNWFRLTSPAFSRSDLAAEYYDEALFGGATFGDLGQRRGPTIVINGTDLSTGARFTFTQEQFDQICSDLDRFPLARAVATSSAYAPSLTPVTLVNYAGACGYTEPAWMKTLDQNTSGTPGRALFRLHELRSYRDSGRRPYLHLFDGGFSDNLGLRGVLEALDTLEADMDAARSSVLKKTRRIVVIVVNARRAPEKDWDRRESLPGTSEIMAQVRSIPVDRYSYEMIEALKDKAEKWRHLLKARQSSQPPVSGSNHAAPADIAFHLIELSFEAMSDKEERRYLLNLPTSFKLPAESVDRLRRAAAVLLRQSPDYRKLLRELGAPEPRF